MNETKQKRKKEPEMILYTILFAGLCVAVLVSIFVPAVLDIGVLCYALIAIIGVVTCSRTKSFMAVDSLVNVYPRGLRKAVKMIKDILMLLVFTVLFIVGILGTIRQLSEPAYSSTLGVPLFVLYALPIVVYPLAVFFYIKAMRNETKEDK
ncbi:MAG: TRAP transporter small permease subunit [Lachnospiraceae bacterium]|nr:TRAP transporter small permease subunit [Lachnospiraceae bacterium]MCD8125010.1 TRAP transporter small permease subunit [Lachnospiraceae bacterium]